MLGLNKSMLVKGVPGMECFLLRQWIITIRNLIAIFSAFLPEKTIGMLNKISCFTPTKIRYKHKVARSYFNAISWKPSTMHEWIQCYVDAWISKPCNRTHYDACIQIIWSFEMAFMWNGIKRKSKFDIVRRFNPVITKPHMILFWIFESLQQPKLNRLMRHTRNIH